MLILTRKLGESLIIGNDVEIVVLGIRGNQVRMGITPPKEASGDREEVFERIQLELQEEAAQLEDDDTKAEEDE